ncbi:MAG TPA: nucleoside kinase, partial [bacterium]
RVVLIAGPSSSGKTTFTKRLSIQLRVNELVPYALSVDDYFLDNALVPRDGQGKPDFESIHALDLARFNADLLGLMQGKSVRLPRFDFMTGKSGPGPVVKLDERQPILIEGLHALNEELTSAVPRYNKFKLYVSALTHLNITNALRVSTSDLRLIRRLVRDHRFRNHSASFTLGHWQQVRNGEEKYIFPFQETANAIFNSSLPYEIGVLRTFTQPLLERVPRSDPSYPEAQRLIEFLHFFKPISKNEVPSNSILSEFIGGSSFVY